jgi:NhaA family Na+:H+ antiporter
MNDLAFAQTPEISDQVTLAVVLASLVAAVIGGALTSARGRHYRRTAARA